MIPSVLSRLLLFSSSYAPLFLILGVLNSFGNQVISVLLYILTVASVAFMWLFLRYQRNFARHDVTIAHVTPHDADTMSYIVTYLLPFISVSYSEFKNAVALFILLFVIAILYIRSNLIYVNPVLNLFGYHLFEVETETGKVIALISRQPYIRTSSTLSVISLGDYILLEERT